MPLLADELEQRLVRIGKLGRALVHQHVFQIGLIDFLVDVVQNRLIGKLVHLLRVLVVQFLDGVVSAGRIGLNVAAGQGGDVFGGRVAGFLGAGAGEGVFLFQ